MVKETIISNLEILLEYAVKGLIYEYKLNIIDMNTFLIYITSMAKMKYPLKELIGNAKIEF